MALENILHGSRELREDNMKIYNTLSRRVQIFQPIREGKVNIYVCGPTLNDVPHLGHARQQITFDVLRRHLEFKGYEVSFVSNITDIEDKIIRKAAELKVDIGQLTNENLRAHVEDYEKIGVKSPTLRPRATEYIPEMIDLIRKLQSEGYTYVIPDDGVYFNVSRFPNYGKLSGQVIKNLRTGVRLEANDQKRNSEDFVLWKFSKPGEPRWESPWGDGRPGWHIECSAMSAKTLGLPLDIHGGGQDLIFPHHEDEIAQSEAGYGCQLANYWMHNGMVNVDNVKMSKSLGNFRTIRAILKEYSGESLRFFVLSAHYRKPLDFTESSLRDARNAHTRLKNIVQNLTDDGEINPLALKDFTDVMDDDLNTPRAISTMWGLLRDPNASGKYRTVETMDSVLGLKLFDSFDLDVPVEIKELATKRDKARKNGNWGEADHLRDQISNSGWYVEDTKDGYSVRKRIKLD